MKIAEFNPNDRSRSNECLDGFLILFIGQTHTLDKEASHTIILQTRKEDIQLLLSAHLNASHTKEGLCIEWSYSQRTDTFLLVFIATVITKNSQEMKLGHYFLEKKTKRGRRCESFPLIVLHIFRHHNCSEREHTHMCSPKMQLTVDLLTSSHFILGLQ